MVILTVALMSLAQLFALSTRANFSARSNTYAAMLAQQKMEQLRGLTWGYDILGLPVSDYTTDTQRQRRRLRLPGICGRRRHGAVAVALGHPAAEHRRLGRLRRSATAASLGGASARLPAIYIAALVRRAAAEQSEQHADSAGAGDQAHRSRRGRCGQRDAAARRGSADERQDEEDQMKTSTGRLGSEAGFTLFEMLVSTALIVLVTGGVFSRAQPVATAPSRRSPRSPTCSSGCGWPPTASRRTW